MHVLQDLAFGVPIDTRRKIIQQQNPGIQSQCPGQHDALLLSTGQAASSLVHPSPHQLFGGGPGVAPLIFVCESCMRQSVSIHFYG